MKTNVFTPMDFPVPGRFQLLICDCDGVIIDSEQIAERVLNTLIPQTFPGHDFTQMWADCFGQPTHAVIEKVARHIGKPIAPSFLEWLDREVDEAIRRDAEVVVGVREALELIPLAVAVVSNSGRDWIEIALARAHLTAKFGSAIFSAERVARPKPAPDIYLTAAQELGVAPARCLVVEDSVAGVTAARAAGMSVLGFVGASHIAPGHADRLRALGVLAIVERMQDLPTAVAAAISKGEPARG
jgi:HAD superfamily hydrolase (TIGR01509 family)